MVPTKIIHLFYAFAMDFRFQQVSGGKHRYSDDSTYKFTFILQLTFFVMFTLYVIGSVDLFGIQEKFMILETLLKLIWTAIFGLELYCSGPNLWSTAKLGLIFLQGQGTFEQSCSYYSLNDFPHVSSTFVGRIKMNLTALTHNFCHFVILIYNCVYNYMIYNSIYNCAQHNKNWLF